MSGYSSLAPNPIALELGLDDPVGPVAVLSQAIESMDAQNGSSLNIPYMYFLEACEKVFDNEMDQTTFEEHTRWLFGKHAYLVYTLDKFLPVLIKQASVSFGSRDFGSNLLRLRSKSFKRTTNARS